MSKFTGHFQEYIGRYVMIASVILVPLAGGLGEAAAEFGGTDTPLGRALIGAASAIGTAAAIGVWLRNLGAWQITEVAQVSKIEADPVEVSPRPDVPPGEPGMRPPRVG